MTCQIGTIFKLELKVLSDLIYHNFYSSKLIHIGTSQGSLTAIIKTSLSVSCDWLIGQKLNTVPFCWSKKCRRPKLCSRFFHLESSLEFYNLCFYLYIKISTLYLPLSQVDYSDWPHEPASQVVDSWHLIIHIFSIFIHILITEGKMSCFHSGMGGSPESKAIVFWAGQMAHTQL